MWWNRTLHTLEVVSQNLDSEVAVRAAIYARVSSADQASADKISINEQVRRCREAALAEGYEVPDDLVFIDAGESGALDEHQRAGYGKFSPPPMLGVLRSSSSGRSIVSHGMLLSP